MTRDDVDSLETVFATWRHYGVDRLVKELRQHPFSDSVAAILRPDDKRSFYRNIVFLVRCYSTSIYAVERTAQLAEGGFPLWIYRAGDCEDHRALDGLVLPAGHIFWTTHAPPNFPGCNCNVLGARHETGARRLGGKPELALDPDWRERFFVAEGFEGTPPFPFATFLRSLIAHQRDADPNRA